VSKKVSVATFNQPLYGQNIVKEEETKYVVLNNTTAL
jgi:hypothetical protein